MQTGRPRLYHSPEDMEQAIEAYFALCDQSERPYTIAGLAYELGFDDRNALSEYAARKEFSSTIKRARTRIETQRSERLVSGEGNVAGMIFDLKNNFGWEDRAKVDHGGQEDNPVVLWANGKSV